MSDLDPDGLDVEVKIKVKEMIDEDPAVDEGGGNDDDAKASKAIIGDELNCSCSSRVEGHSVSDSADSNSNNISSWADDSSSESELEEKEKVAGEEVVPGVDDGHKVRSGDRRKRDKKIVAQNQKVMAGPSFFYEDEVCRKTKSGDVEFGMVTENWEMYSSDEDDEDDPDKVLQGHVAVTWHPRGRDEILPEAKVQLSDRSLMPGDVVRRLIDGKDTQRGYCRAVQVLATVQILNTKKVIPNVLASELSPVQKLQTEVAVYLDSWIGVTSTIHFKLGLRFADSSFCYAKSFAIQDHFIDTKRNECFGNSETFYPGQRLRGPLSFLRDAEWSYCSDEIKRAKDRKIVVVTVVDVEPSSVSVNWQWQTPDSEMEKREIAEIKDEKAWKKGAPADPVNGDNIKRLKCLNLFESCAVQLGDISFYTPSTISFKDTIMEKADWKKSILSAPTCTSPPIAIALDGNKTSRNSSQANLVNNNISTVNPTAPSNQNQSNELGQIQEDEVKSIVAAAVKVHENKENSSIKKSLPKVSTRALRKKKLKKAKHNVQNNYNVNPDSPLVVEIIHTKSIVDVIWQDGSIEEGMPSTDLYPIHHLDDHEFFPGDFVVKADSVDFRTYGVVQNMDHIGRVALVKWFEAYSLTGEQRPIEIDGKEMSVYDLKDHPDFRFRPGTIVIRVANMLEDQLAAGQILDNYPDGQVKVWWANGCSTSCWPQDLFRLGDYDSDEGEIWDENEQQSENDDDEDDEIDSDGSWETEAEEAEEVNDSDQKESNRYKNIGKQMENIQKSLVLIREKLVITTPIISQSQTNESSIPQEKPVHTLDRRGIARKLLIIYKDCQYLDKMMETKFFNEDILKDWFKKIGVSASSKSGILPEQMNRLFELPPSSSSPNSKAISSVIINENEVFSAVVDTDIVVVTEAENGPEEVQEAQLIVSDLCTLILNKLLAAHSEYLARFEELESKTSELDKNVSVSLDKKSDAGQEDHEQESKLELDEGKTASTTDNEISKPKLDSNENNTSLVEEGKEVKIASSPSIMLATKETITALKVKGNNFNMIESIPDTHRYRITTFLPQNQRGFLRTIQKESALLREFLPEGIFVKGFEDRIDLYSVMIHGPEKTPYEDGLFFFDIQLPPAYPSAPPLVHYVSFCSDRLNPNLYECGKVCVSLLGTWTGKGTEVWTSNSSLLQLLISIQGLILVPEPYYNEAGYEKQRGSQQGSENSRVYNEMVLIKLVQSMSRMKMNMHVPWQKEILNHLKVHGPRMIERYRKWLKLSDIVEEKQKQNCSNRPSEENLEHNEDYPEFPLLPVSKGFSITLNNLLENFAKLCDENSAS